MKRSTMFVVAVLLAWNASAQVAPVSELHCCRCVDGPPSSSLNLSTGQASPTDQLWTVNGVAAATSASPNPNWLTSIPTGWIEPAVSSPGTFHYKTSFIVPNCTIPMAVTLTGKFAADNNGAVTLDGTTTIASCSGSNCFSSSGGAPFAFSASITPGFHTLQVDVTNVNGVTGLSVQATLRVVCRNCEPCPIVGSYDGANCQIGQAPAGTSAFIYNNNFYYTPIAGNQCPLAGSWFDSANCYVMPVPPGTAPFIWQNTWWYVQSACHPVAKPQK